MEERMQVELGQYAAEVFRFFGGIGFGNETLAGVDEHASAVGEFYPAFEVGCLSRPQSDLDDPVEHLADHRGIFLLCLRVHGLVLFKKLVVLEYQIVIEEVVAAVAYGAGNRDY